MAITPELTHICSGLKNIDSHRADHVSEIDIPLPVTEIAYEFSKMVKLNGISPFTGL